MVTALLLQSGLPPSLWGMATEVAVHLQNCQLTASNSDAKAKMISPFESYYARSSKFKFGAVAEQGYFVGYGKNFYKVLHKNKRLVIDVPFNEVVFYETAFNNDDTHSDQKVVKWFASLPNSDNMMSFQSEEALHSLQKQAHDDMLVHSKVLVKCSEHENDQHEQGEENQKHVPWADYSNIDTESVPIPFNIDSDASATLGEEAQFEGMSTKGESSDDLHVFDNASPGSTLSCADDEWPIPRLDSAEDESSSLLTQILQPDFGWIEAEDTLLNALIACTQPPVTALSIDLHPIPSTIEEARQQSDWRGWQKAINSEYTSLLKDSTWEVGDQAPADRKPLPCKWVQNQDQI
ncbi:hypothetical protein MIR68_011804 [Amoeboaphelidium protococcarum]|nr:hypothetical protein MIR68_011804 [Amoeboaphelidium protococcarum]